MAEVTETEVEEVETEEQQPTETEKTTDWQHQSRQWENKARKERKEREKLEATIKEQEDLQKSATEKAIEAARQEGETVARTASDKERRADRLENAAIKIATKGVQLQDEDGKKVTIKFADSDDAVTYVERAIRRGDIDEEDIFTDDGKVKQDEMTRVLTELLTTKPHLAATSGKAPKVSGSADGGRGSAGTKTNDEMTPEEWFARLSKKAA